MQKNGERINIEITKDEVLDVLKQLGHPKFNKRLLTEFSRKGLLPELKRTSRPGSNKPVYVWNIEVIGQIVELYKLVESGYRDYETRLLYLWLCGYKVPFDPLSPKNIWFQVFNEALDAITNGTENTEDRLDRVSEFVSERISPNWRFSPRVGPMIRRVGGLDNYRDVMEHITNTFLVPNYEPSEHILTLVTTSQISWKAAETNQIDYTEAPTPSQLEETRALFRTIQELFTCSQLRDTFLNATREEWEQARDDCQTLWQLLCVLIEKALHLVLIFIEQASHFGLIETEQISHFRLKIQELLELLNEGFLLLGIFAVPVVLSAKHHGYSHGVDSAIVSIKEVLTYLNDPEILTYLNDPETYIRRSDPKAKAEFFSNFTEMCTGIELMIKALNARSCR